MKLNQLRYFTKIAELKSFHRAAEELHIAQPALTRQIMQLETELGAQLFERLPRGVQLTASGDTFVVGARQILANIEELVNNTRRNIEDPVGNLLVAFEDSVSQNSIIAKGLQMIGIKNPRVTVNLLPLSERHQVERLRNREIDIGFAYDSCGEFSQHSELGCHTISRDELVLAVARDHWLADLPTIHVSDLVNEPFVMIAKDKAPKQGYEHLIRSCEMAGLYPRIVQEVPSIDGLFNLVSVGLGVTLCARGVRRYPPDNVVMRRVEGLNVTFDFTLMWRQRSQSDVARRFIEIIKAIQVDVFPPIEVSSPVRAASTDLNYLTNRRDDKRRCDEAREGDFGRGPTPDLDGRLEAAAARGSARAGTDRGGDCRSGASATKSARSLTAKSAEATAESASVVV